MLTAYPIAPGPTDLKLAADFGGKTWVDLFEPTPEEAAAVGQAYGVSVPTLAEVSEIEATSRLRFDGGVLSMSAPLISRQPDGALRTAPTGFVLTERVCITVRFEDTGAFDTVIKDLASRSRLEPCGVFARVVEEVVDRAADHLEQCAEELNQASHAIFREEKPKRARLVRDTDSLRKLMIQAGRASEHMSHVRYTLVCVGRMAQFTADRARDWLPPEVQEQLQGVKADVASLEQFEENLLSRVQLLQDAATAFISIEQNDVVKVLTIASVVGIPPVLVVGLYGMNFKYMPELAWRYGYPYALALIAVATLVPLIWFKLKNWM